MRSLLLPITDQSDVTVEYTYIVTIFAKKYIENSKKILLHCNANHSWKKKFHLLTLMILNLLHLPVGQAFFQRKKINEPIVFDKLKVFTKNEGSKYYRSDQLNDLGFKRPDQETSVLYLNISSLPYHIDDLTEFLITISPQISKG